MVVDLYFRQASNRVAFRRHGTILRIHASFGKSAKFADLNSPATARASDGFDRFSVQAQPLHRADHQRLRAEFDFLHWMLFQSGLGADGGAVAFYRVVACANGV